MKQKCYLFDQAKVRLLKHGPYPLPVLMAVGDQLAGALPPSSGLQCGADFSKV